MTLQTTIFILWLVASLIVIAAFYMVYRRSVAIPSSATYGVINSKRFRFFYLLVLGFLIIFFIALSNAPYSTFEKPDEIIGVKARMFYFELTKDTVRSGQLVEFRVSAEDVTHGFGLYNASGALIGQVQAMPGYINRLRVKFEQPGQYHALCLEYCGPVHHQMRDTIFVE